MTTTAPDIIKGQRAAPKTPPTAAQGNAARKNTWLKSVYVDFGGREYRYDVAESPKKDNDVVSIEATEEYFIIDTHGGERTMLNFANAQIVKTRTNNVE